MTGSQESDFDHIEDYETCPLCEGDGSIEVPAPQRDDPYYCRTEQCGKCDGCGWVLREPSPVMRASARAARVVASWSKSKQEYAKRVVRDGEED